MGFSFVPETHQSGDHLLIFQEPELILPNLYLPRDARPVIQGIIVAKPMVVQDFIHHFAAFAAKDPVLQPDLPVPAGLTAMGANQFLFGGFLHKTAQNSPSPKA